MTMVMRSLPMQMWKEAKPLLKIPSSFLDREVVNPWKPQRDKVLFIMGATGTGKSRLSVDLGTAFPAEIINSDKIQVYKGLDIVTNKVTKEEQRGIPHHLLGIVNPDVDYTPEEFCLMATHSVESILQKNKLPIIVGGSNSYIESLVEDPKYEFKLKYNCYFLWVDVSINVLHSFVSHRVDKMVHSGLVDEVRQVFDRNNSDYTLGIRRAIGVPELDMYLRNENHLDDSGRVKALQDSINEIKINTCKLANKQLQKIYRLKELKGWGLNRVDATEVMRKRDKDAADEAWEKMVSRPSLKLVTRFLSDDFDSSLSRRIVSRSMVEKSRTLISTI